MKKKRGTKFDETELCLGTKDKDLNPYVDFIDTTSQKVEEERNFESDPLISKKKAQNFRSSHERMSFSYDLTLTHHEIQRLFFFLGDKTILAKKPRNRKKRKIQRSKREIKSLPDGEIGEMGLT